MKAKHAKTLRSVFTKPTLVSISFSDMESLVIALGGEVREEKVLAWYLRSTESACTRIGRIRARTPSAIKLRNFVLYWNQKESNHE